MNLLNDIRRAALHFLARREYSIKELSQKLRAKKFSEENIQLLLTELIQENAISDSRFTENYIHQKRSKGYGPLYIRAGLLEKGIPEDLIHIYLFHDEDEWIMLINKVWQKRFKGIKPLDFKKKAQQMRFLQSRGFTSSQIEALFK